VGAFAGAYCLPRQVRDDGVEIPVGAGGEHGLEPLLELLGEQPSFAGSVTEPFGELLAIRV
jgi:hypothetical protein